MTIPMRDVPRPPWASELFGCLLALLGLAWAFLLVGAVLAGSWWTFTVVFLAPAALVGFCLVLGELWQVTAVRWYHADQFPAHVERLARAERRSGHARRAMQAQARLAAIPTPDLDAFADLMRDAGAGHLEEL